MRRLDAFPGEVMSVNDPAIRSIRRADARDLAKMIASLADFHGDVATATEQDLIAFCVGPNKLAAVLMAFVEGRAVGFLASRDWVNLVRGTRVRHIELIFVDTDYRHLGIGSALIKAAARSAFKAGCERLTVGAVASNEIADRFYRKLGFKARDDESRRYALTDLEALG